MAVRFRRMLRVRRIAEEETFKGDIGVSSFRPMAPEFCLQDRCHADRLDLVDEDSLGGEELQRAAAEVGGFLVERGAGIGDVACKENLRVSCHRPGLLGSWGNFRNENRLR